jgi:3-hydroxymyristoyl/3-hydroxydecanoyl-(acyl carrier protein) dehydratase
VRSEAVDPLAPRVLAERKLAGGYELDLEVPADLPCFAGHFPTQPIVPGVVQLAWVVRLAAERLGRALEPGVVEYLKFSKRMLPRDRVTLALEPSEDGARLAFRFSAHGALVARGQLALRQPEEIEP